MAVSSVTIHERGLCVRSFYSIDWSVGWQKAINRDTGIKLERKDVLVPSAFWEADLSEDHLLESIARCDSTAAYSMEIITSSAKPVLVTNCGLRVSAHRTFRRVRGEIDTLLIAGGSALEDDETGIDVMR
jgi:hypothetical protein